MPLYKYAPVVVVVTALLVLSTFTSANAVAVSGNCRKSTHYTGEEDWNDFLKNNDFRNGMFVRTCLGVSKKCFGENTKMTCKSGKITWPCRGKVQNAVNKVHFNELEEKKCEYSTNNGRKAILRIFNENGSTKFGVKLLKINAVETNAVKKSLDVPFGDVHTRYKNRRNLLNRRLLLNRRSKHRRRRLLKGTTSTC